MCPLSLAVLLASDPLECSDCLTLNFYCVMRVSPPHSPLHPIRDYNLTSQSDCAVYCNKHGDVSRSVIMEFVGKAKTAAIYGPYILLFDTDFVEIRNAENGRLRQVIAGRDCRCLDDARSGSQAGRTLKLGMAHPEVDGRQLVVELIMQEGQSD